MNATWTGISASLLAIVLTQSACSSSKDTSESSSSPQATAGAGGGAKGSAGKGGEGWFGSTSGGAPSADYTIEACPGVTPEPGVIGDIPACDDICGAAHCVPAANAGGDMAFIPNCPTQSGAGVSKCVPDVIIALGGKFAYSKCQAAGGDAVCIPGCLIDKVTRGFLMQGTCGAGELCAPCTDPAACAPKCGGDGPSFRP